VKFRNRTIEGAAVDFYHTRFAPEEKDQGIRHDFTRRAQISQSFRRWRKPAALTINHRTLAAGVAPAGVREPTTRSLRPKRVSSVFSNHTPTPAKQQDVVRPVLNVYLILDSADH